MSYLLFMDESGHDRKHAPYEIHGGVAIRAERVWHFTISMRDLELASFGAHLHDFGSEVKGEKLLARKTFEWSVQTDPRSGSVYKFVAADRRNLARQFLERGKSNADLFRRGVAALPPTRLEMTAYGQACLDFADGIFDLLVQHGAFLFAAAIPRTAPKRQPGYSQDFLRKDLVFLLERYFYLLQRDVETGLLILDQCEPNSDRRDGRLMANYFTKTEKGRERSRQLVPVPLFVTQDLSYALHAADVCIYAMNWGYDFDRRMTASGRVEIKQRYGDKINALRFSTRLDSGSPSDSFVYVLDPYRGKQGSNGK